MARVKRGTKRRARRKKISQAHKGLFPHQEQALPVRAGSRQNRADRYAFRDRRVKKARISQAVD